MWQYSQSHPKCEIIALEGTTIEIQCSRLQIMFQFLSTVTSTLNCY